VITLRRLLETLIRRRSRLAALAAVLVLCSAASAGDRPVEPNYAKHRKLNDGATHLTVGIDPKWSTIKTSDGRACDYLIRECLTAYLGPVCGVRCTEKVGGSWYKAQVCFRCGWWDEVCAESRVLGPAQRWPSGQCSVYVAYAPRHYAPLIGYVQKQDLVSRVNSNTFRRFVLHAFGGCFDLWGYGVGPGGERPETDGITDTKFNHLNCKFSRSERLALRRRFGLAWLEKR